MKTIQGNRKNIKEIVAALKNGAVLVLPTDTVYGLVCDAKNNEAIERIFSIKQRDKSKPLAVFVKDIKMVKEYSHIDDAQKKLLKKSWPGAVTFILEARLGLAELLYKKSTVGMRVPDYELIRLIFREFDNPLAQTSANISGKPATTKIKDILEQFQSEDILIVNAGDLKENRPSKVVDLTKRIPRTLRH